MRAKDDLPSSEALTGHGQQVVLGSHGPFSSHVNLRDLSSFNIQTTSVVNDHQVGSLFSPLVFSLLLLLYRA